MTEKTENDAQRIKRLFDERKATHARKPVVNLDAPFQTASTDVESIKGKVVDDSQIGDKKVLAYNATTGKLGYTRMHAAGSGAGFTWKDPPLQCYEDLNRVVDLALTDINLTTYTATNAKAALIKVEHQAVVMGAGDYVTWQFKQKDSGAGEMVQLNMFHDLVQTAFSDTHDVIVGLDVNRIVQMSISLTAGWTVTTRLFVLGYWT
jgi:hypothetical protein